MPRELTEILDELCDPAKAIPYMEQVNAAKRSLIKTLDKDWDLAWDRYNRTKKLVFTNIYTPTKPRWWQRLLKSSRLKQTV